MALYRQPVVHVTFALSFSVSDVLQLLLCSEHQLFSYPTTIPHEVWGCFRWTRLIMLGDVESVPWPYLTRPILRTNSNNQTTVNLNITDRWPLPGVTVRRSVIRHRALKTALYCKLKIIGLGLTITDFQLFRWLSQEAALSLSCHCCERIEAVWNVHRLASDAKRRRLSTQFTWMMQGALINAVFGV